MDFLKISPGIADFSLSGRLKQSCFGPTKKQMARIRQKNKLWTLNEFLKVTRLTKNGHEKI